MTTSMLRSSRVVLPAAIALALTASALVGAGATTTSAATTTRGNDSTAIDFAQSLSTAFRQAAADISPSVVNITSVEKMTSNGTIEMAPDGTEEFFRRFFGNDPRFRMTPQQTPAPERRGQGSGVILRTDGYILTNNHVVEGADKLTVRLGDGRELTAKVVGTDPDSDLAIIHVDASGLPAAHMGNSDDMQPGDWVVAVGNPYGLDHTVTAGVVSALGRAGIIDPEQQPYEDFIQTDAAINPGNSGGPLVNLHGEVIGINAAIRTSNGGSDGIGFAIPSNLAEHVAQSLIDNGKVERGFLGVHVQPLTPALARNFDFDGKGVLVNNVEDDTPAAKAGMKSGDIICKLNGQQVDSPNKLVNAIGQMEPGDKVTLSVTRDGQEQQFKITLAERPPTSQLAMKPGSSSTDLGLTLQPLTPQLAQQLGTAVTEGLVVVQVEPDSAAAEAQPPLQAEDIILEANHQPVRTPQDLASAAGSATHGVLLKVIRSGQTFYVVLGNEDKD
jgi:serine protease Do